MNASDVTLTVQFQGMQGNDSVGLPLFSQPAVGSSHTGYWQNDGGGWQYLTNSAGYATGFGVEIQGTMASRQATEAITWTNPAPLIYGAALTYSQLNATANVPGSFAYSPASGAVLNAGTNLLSVVFTPSDGASFNVLTGSVVLVVLPAPLAVTANDATRPYGATNPPLTGIITGLTNGDDITATYSCAATPASPAGFYPIVPSLVDPNNRLGNYALTVTNGTLTVRAQSVGPSRTPSPTLRACRACQAARTARGTRRGSSGPRGWRWTVRETCTWRTVAMTRFARSRRQAW